MATTETRVSTRSRGDVAPRLATALRPFVGQELPVRLRAWDGSEAGPQDAPLVELRSPNALRRLIWNPSELGAAQAYVTGELEVRGDLDATLTHVWSVAAQRGLSGVRRSPRAVARALRTALAVGAVGRAPSTSRLPGTGARTAAQQAARPAGDQPPLRPVQRVLLTAAGPVDGVLLGLLALRRPVVHRAGRAARQARPGLSQDRAGARACASSTSGAAGVRCRCTRRSTSAPRSPASPSPPSRRSFIDARIQERGLQDRVEIRLQDYREIPEVGGARAEPVRRRRLDRDG